MAKRKRRDDDKGPKKRRDTKTPERESGELRAIFERCLELARATDDDPVGKWEAALFPPLDPRTQQRFDDDKREIATAIKLWETEALSRLSGGRYTLKVSEFAALTLSLARWIDRRTNAAGQPLLDFNRETNLHSDRHGNWIPDDKREAIHGLYVQSREQISLALASMLDPAPAAADSEQVEWTPYESKTTLARKADICTKTLTRKMKDGDIRWEKHPEKRLWRILLEDFDGLKK